MMPAFLQMIHGNSLDYGENDDSLGRVRRFRCWKSAGWVAEGIYVVIQLA